MLSESVPVRVFDSQNLARREFLRIVPVAATAFALADLLPASAAAQTTPALTEGKFKVIGAAELADDTKVLDAKPDTTNLFIDKNFTVALTAEKAASAKEFEWHEHRDHVFHILDGSTTYELGGTPQNAHSTGPGEWLAPASEGATKLTVKKGDMLIIRRGTPHKRTTQESVTFMLMAPITPPSA